MHNRSQELGYITRKLKLLAQKMSLPIIIISQLNRNIENRQNKEPILSDLRESGCISTRNSVNFFSKNKNRLNILNLNEQNNALQSYQMKNLKKQNITINYHKFITTKKLFNIFGQINISYKYLFKHFTNSKTCTITYNHKSLNQNNWISSNKILKLTTTTFVPQGNKHSFIYNKYINLICFDKYEKSYDVNQNACFNILCEDNVLHNSIEQDADIIIILYKNGYINTERNLEDNNLLDLKISKNRNGKVGYSKVRFIPEINQFQTK